MEINNIFTPVKVSRRQVCWEISRQRRILGGIQPEGRKQSVGHVPEMVVFSAVFSFKNAFRRQLKQPFPVWPPMLGDFAARPVCGGQECPPSRDSSEV
jgi:hypothetical protein